MDQCRKLCTKRGIIGLFLIVKIGLFLIVTEKLITTPTLIKKIDVSASTFNASRPMLSEGEMQISLTNNSECQRNESTFKEINEPFSALVFMACGKLIERIQLFTAALERLRMQRFIPIVKTQNWTINAPDQLHLLAGWNESFFTELSNYSQITTVILPWLRSPLQRDEDWSSLTDSSNLLIPEYYESTATDPLCTWIETPGKVTFSFDVINNWTCNRNTTLGAIPRSLSLLELNAKAPYEEYYFPSVFPDQFFTQLPQILHSLQIIKSGVANRFGDVFIRNAKIVPYTCWPDKKLNPPENIDQFPLYDEVFVIAQSFGENLYHRLGETTPRIAMYVEFLLRNPKIMILAPQDYMVKAELLTVLGIESHRILNGVWCRAEIIYLPRATPCCFPHFLETQVLSLNYRKYLKRNFPNDTRNKVIFIRRTGRRYFHNQPAIESIVEKAAKEYKLIYDVFRDDPAPPMVDMMRMFNSAVMVVASHGAGLGNLVFSEPGTFVIEGLCNRPHTHLFFQRTAKVLGHRWHGIPGTDGCSDPGGQGVQGAVTIEPSIINDTIRTYLDLWHAMAFRSTSSLVVNSS